MCQLLVTGARCREGSPLSILATKTYGFKDSTIHLELTMRPVAVQCSWHVSAGVGIAEQPGGEQREAVQAHVEHAQSWD